MSLQICPGPGMPMRPVDPAVFVADLGLKGCRHAKSNSRRQVLLIEEETLVALGLQPALLKENVTTRGIDLTYLPADTRLRLGEEVELWVTGPCHIAALPTPGTVVRDAASAGWSAVRDFGSRIYGEREVAQ